MASEENTAPVKETMQKAGVKFQEKWDIDNNSKFGEKSDSSSDSSKSNKVEEKWNVNRNSGTSSQKKNAVLMEIFHDVASSLSEKWDTSYHDEKQGSQKGDGSAAKDGKEDEQKNLEGDGRDSSSSHSPTSESPTGDNPYVQAPVPTSQFEWTSE